MTSPLLPADDLDRLLGRYFQSQLPDPWPACPATGTTEPSALYLARRSADPAPNGRLTLAASAAVLLGLGLYATSGPRPVPPAAKAPATGPAGLMSEATADGSRLFDAGTHAPKTSP